MPLQTDIFSHNLAKHYTRFDVANRLLFTGHSHQAWPDVALEGLIDSFDTAAALVDTKWEKAFEKIDLMRSYLRKFYDDPAGLYTHGENTHNLFTRWLSSLDLKNKPRKIVSDSEFYSIYRQVARLAEEGIEIVYVPALPLEGLAKRLADELTSETAAVMLSRVYFETGLLNTELSECAQACRDAGVPLLIDDYHGTNVVPVSLREANLEDCFVLIGGYKYMQWGEGNCFLRFPSDCELRPVLTGWFASFGTLKLPRNRGPVPFDSGNERFAGATFDSVSAFRGARVVQFFEEQNLTPIVLNKIYREHVAWMKYRFLALGLDPHLIQLAHNYPLTLNGGFLSLRSPNAQKYWSQLKEKDVLTDCRNDILRFGSAPYMTSGQIDEAFSILARVVTGD